MSESTFRLADYGYTPTVGYFVWNRDKRPAYMTLDEVPEYIGDNMLSHYFGRATCNKAARFFLTRAHPRTANTAM